MEFITSVTLGEEAIEEAIKNFIKVEYGKDIDEILESQIITAGNESQIRLKFIERF